jgi:hypothetical protein
LPIKICFIHYQVVCDVNLSKDEKNGIQRLAEWF